jgi:threonine aldolase
MRIVDLRSDTVTLPDEAMREVIARAEVGDDVFGEDPSINRLQELSAEITGKEAGLFVPSGSMGNLVCLLAHCERGDEIYLGQQDHIFMYEAASAAVVGGIQHRIFSNREDGTIDLDEVAAAQRSDDAHQPRSRLISVENTHNRCAGSPLSLDYMAAVRDFADQRELRVHLDGARIFNAALALDCSVAELCSYADSMTFCLSKGLGAPVGSVICASKDFIYKAHRARKMLGGGMRQAGLLAAAGTFALENRVDRLAEDHANAKRLAEGISEIPGIDCKADLYKSNLVYFELEGDRDPDAFVTSMAERGVRFFKLWAKRFRLVTHFGIEAEDIEFALDAFRRECGSDPK